MLKYIIVRGIRGIITKSSTNCRSLSMRINAANSEMFWNRFNKDRSVFLFRIEKKNNLQVRLNFYQIVKFESRFHQLCNMNGVEQRRLLSTKHVCCQDDKNRRGKNAFTINLLAIFLYRSLKYQNKTLCSPHKTVIVFYSMNTIDPHHMGTHPQGQWTPY